MSGEIKVDRYRWRDSTVAAGLFDLACQLDLNGLWAELGYRDVQTARAEVSRDNRRSLTPVIDGVKSQRPHLFITEDGWYELAGASPAGDTRLFEQWVETQVIERVKKQLAPRRVAETPAMPDLQTDLARVVVGQQSDGSPFDAIRRVRPDGSEYWSARELMPLLGYSNWQNFGRVIDDAWVSCCNTMEREQARRLFTGVDKKSGGRPALDFELARYACYLVAMNCDPRKAEVAAAQQYFVVKTREAELAVTQTGRELSRLEILRLATESELGRLAAEAKVSELEPAAQAWGDLVDTGASLRVSAAADRLVMLGIDTGGQRLYDYMREIGWVYKRSTQPIRDAVDKGWLDLAWGKPYYNEKSKKMEQGDAYSLVTAAGLKELHRRLGETG